MASITTHINKCDKLTCSSQVFLMMSFQMGFFSKESLFPSLQCETKLLHGSYKEAPKSLFTFISIYSYEAKINK